MLFALAGFVKRNQSWHSEDDQSQGSEGGRNTALSGQKQSKFFNFIFTRKKKVCGFLLQAFTYLMCFYDRKWQRRRFRTPSRFAPCWSAPLSNSRPSMWRSSWDDRKRWRNGRMTYCQSWRSRWTACRRETAISSTWKTQRTPSTYYWWDDTKHLLGHNTRVWGKNVS